MIKSITDKCLDKIKLLFKKEIDLKDFMLDSASHLLNLSRLQRRLRRKVFPLERITCNSFSPSDNQAYQRFIYSYSAYARVKKRKNKDAEDPLVSFRLNSNNLFYVARYKDSIVGVVWLGYKGLLEDYSLWHLSGLAILKNYQGFGVATKLTLAAIDALEDKRKIVFLRVDNKNFRAINFYKKLGFSQDRALSGKILADNRMGFQNGDNRFLFRRYW
jgi:GNAT superfamily N-acetyltransferase